MIYYNLLFLWEEFLEILVGGRLYALAHGMHSVGLVVVRVVGPANNKGWKLLELGLRAVARAAGLLLAGRAPGRGGCCTGGGDALALAAGCGVGSSLDVELLGGGVGGVYDVVRVRVFGDLISRNPG